MSQRRITAGAILWLAVYCVALAWSAWRPHDWPTWFLEVAPALAGLAALAATRRRFPLTTLVYALILLHCIVLMVGGHYTYAKVPLFDDLKEAFHLQRNNYDKLGHFVQGFVPAMIAREILIRLRVINGALAQFPDRLLLSGAQRILRTHRMVGRRVLRGRGHGVPGNPGLRLGYAIGHVPRPDRRGGGAVDAIAVA